MHHNLDHFTPKLGATIQSVPTKFVFNSLSLILSTCHRESPFYVQKRRHRTAVVIINGKHQPPDHMDRDGGAAARKVMVVADPTRESAGALQYALYHAVLENDLLILLHVENMNSWRNSFATFLKRSPSTSHGGTGTTGSGCPGIEGVGGSSIGGGGGDGNMDFLEEMKKACKIAQPTIRVQVVMVELEGNNKGATILSQANSMSIDLLIIGQRQSLSAAILGSRRNNGGSNKAQSTADFLIENCKCTCVGVQRKGQKAGYLLNTKTHRNFWLLA
ncbi:unnamed protein product [Rhodiola kirilowii]